MISRCKHIRSKIYQAMLYLCKHYKRNTIFEGCKCRCDHWVLSNGSLWPSVLVLVKPGIALNYLRDAGFASVFCATDSRVGAIPPQPQSPSTTADTSRASYSLD
jgi:hypothetical protein